MNMIACRSRWSLFFRVDRVLRFSTAGVNSRPVHCFQGNHSYLSLMMSGAKDKANAFDGGKKQKTMGRVWRPVSTQATASKESSIIEESEDRSQSQDVHYSASSNVSDAQHASEASDLVSSTLNKDFKDRVFVAESELSAEKHSISMEIGASVIRFVRGKEGSTQKKIEEETGVKLIFPWSRKEDSITIEGSSLDSITRASEMIQTIIDEAVQTPSLDYSHFVSLPLAIHPELVDKLNNFQNSILGVGDSSLNEGVGSDSNSATSENEDKSQQTEKVAKVAVDLKIEDNKEHVEVDITDIPLVSYPPKSKASKSSKSSKSSNLSALRIEKSIVCNPKTFHLTVLMLKLWNKERVNTATEVLNSVSSKVMDALDNRPIFVRLKGLDCMKGSLEKARVVYVPVEEIGDGDRLINACQIITDAFIKAGLVLDNDLNHKLKLHATVMNARYRKSKFRNRSRKVEPFDARNIFQIYGSKAWGEYHIREAHLSQRFVYDENGYYHCCASIPFPENMQVV